MKVDLCRTSEIPAEGSMEVVFFDRKVHIVRGAGGQPIAYLDICPHMGGTLACDNGYFQCAWHSSAFDKDTGARIAGPAENNTQLMRLPTRVEDGILMYVYGEDVSRGRSAQAA